MKKKKKKLQAVTAGAWMDLWDGAARKKSNDDAARFT